MVLHQKTSVEEEHCYEQNSIIMQKNKPCQYKVMLFVSQYIYFLNFIYTTLLFCVCSAIFSQSVGPKVL